MNSTIIMCEHSPQNRNKIVTNCLFSILSTFLNDLVQESVTELMCIIIIV